MSNIEDSDFRYVSRTDAPGAGINTPGNSVSGRHLHPLDVGMKHALCLVVGMTDVVANSLRLSADAAARHDRSTSLNPVITPSPTSACIR